MKIPFFVWFDRLEVLLTGFGKALNQKRIEVELGVLKRNIFECSFPVFCVKIVLFYIVESKWLRRSLIVVLLQRIDVLACLCIPDVDPAIEGRCHQDTLLLDELQNFHSLCVSLHLPFEIDAASIQNILDEVSSFKLYFFFAKVIMLKFLEKLSVVIAAEIHFIINDVKQPISPVEATQSNTQVSVFFLAIFVLESQQSFESERERRYSNQSYTSAWCGCDYNFFACLADWCELLDSILHVCSHAFSCLNIEKRERSSICSNHY